MTRTKHTRFLVLAANYWGTGDTQEDAVEAMTGAGGSVLAGYELIEFDETAIFQGVNGVWGVYEYTAAEGHEFPNAPTKRTVEPLEALISRKQDITRALVNDDIDEDIAEELRAERAEINEALRQMTP